MMGFQFAICDLPNTRGDWFMHICMCTYIGDCVYMYIYRRVDADTSIFIYPFCESVNSSKFYSHFSI